MLCAAALVGSLGLAWFQVAASRALGPPVRIRGTPLIVRPPRGWMQDAQRPGRFVERVRIEGMPNAHVERRITFHYQRWSAVPPLGELLTFRNWRERVTDVSNLVAARVGGLSGVQLHRTRRFEFMGRVEVGESVYRLAVSPRGDEITVEYTPVRKLTAGDLDLLEAVCAAVRVDDPSLQPGEEVLRDWAGMRVVVKDGERLFGPDLPEMPGLFVEGTERGVPAFSIGVFRTWLAGGRSAEDLVRDQGMSRWLMPANKVPVERDDLGARVHALTLQPASVAPGSAGAEIVAIHVVSDAPDRTAMLLVWGSAGKAQAAQRAAARIAEKLEFTSAFPKGLDRAVAEGQALAQAVSRGVMQRWGSELVTEYYRAEVVQAPEYRVRPLLLVNGRAMTVGSPGAYDGIERVVGGTHLDETMWHLAADGQGYSWRHDLQFSTRRVLVEESRDGSSSSVRRDIVRGRAQERQRFEVGGAFVCPPLETAAESQTAWHADGPVVMEVSAALGEGTNMRLLWPRESGEVGEREVVVLDDYEPRPTVLHFDGPGRLASQEQPGVRLWRISPEEAEKLQRRLTGR